MARLPQGIIKRKDGLLQKRFTIQGKRYSVYAHTLDELANKEQSKRLEIASGLYRPNSTITLDGYFQEYIKSKQKHTKGSTLYNYKSVYYSHISKNIGKRKLKDLERRECIALQDKLRETESVSIANRSLLLLATILNSAVTDEILVRNVAKGIKPIKEQSVKATKTIHKALSEQEQESFLHELKENESYYYELIAFMLSTGLRIGEVVALSWKDIDTRANVIHITKTISRDVNGNRIITTPKTATSIRDIPMNPGIKNILAEQKKKYFLNCQANGTPIDERIFSTPYGLIPLPKQINREIERTIKSLNEKGVKIHQITCHALRDTFATRYIEQGGNPQTLKTILGHSSLAMTMDLYSQVMPNTKQEEMNRLQIRGL